MNSKRAYDTQTKIHSLIARGRMTHKQRFTPSIHYFSKQLEAIDSTAGMTLYGGAAGGGKTETAKAFILRNIIPEASIAVFRKQAMDLESESGPLAKVLSVIGTPEGKLWATKKTEWRERSVSEINKALEDCKRFKIPRADPRYPFQSLKRIRGEQNRGLRKVAININYIFDLENERGEYVFKPEDDFKIMHFSELEPKVLYYADLGGFFAEGWREAVLRKILADQKVAERFEKAGRMLRVRRYYAARTVNQNKQYQAVLYYWGLNDANDKQVTRRAGVELSHSVVDEAQEITDALFLRTVVQRTTLSAKYEAIHPEKKSQIFLNCNPRVCWIYDLIKDKLLDRSRHNAPNIEACQKIYYTLNDDTGRMILIDKDLPSDRELAENHFARSQGENWDTLRTFKFIPAKASDNPHLDSGYISNIRRSVGTETEMRPLIDGCWVFDKSTSLFPRDRFKRYDVINLSRDEFYDSIDMFLIAVDTAHKSDKHHDNTAIYLYGAQFFPDDKVYCKRPFKLFVLDGQVMVDSAGKRDNEPVTVLEKCMLFIQRYEHLILRPTYMALEQGSDRQQKIYNTGIIIAECASTGITLGSQIKLKYTNIEFYEGSVIRGQSKYNRAKTSSTYVRQECIYVPAIVTGYKDVDGIATPIMEDTELTKDLLDEVSVFGEVRGARDDRVDFLVYAIERTLTTIFEAATQRTHRERHPIISTIKKPTPQTNQEAGAKAMLEIQKIFENATLKR